MFQYTKDCVIGVDAIDQDHQHLFDLINEGLNLLHNDYIPDKYDAIKELLDELLDYANNHFAREEAYMTSICDPEIILQRVQHDQFRSMIWELSSKALDTNDEQKIVLEETLSFLAKWLYHHILGSDIMIGHLEPLDAWMMKEDPCAFTEEYLTGIPLIDEEHRTLFEITGHVVNMIREGIIDSDIPEILKILGELRDYTHKHFTDEEAYMARIHYDGLESQQRAHAAFIAELDDIDSEQIRQQPEEYLRSLIEFLLGWLINHILKTDKLIPAE